MSAPDPQSQRRSSAVNGLGHVHGTLGTFAARRQATAHWLATWGAVVLLGLEGHPLAAQSPVGAEPLPRPAASPVSAPGREERPIPSGLRRIKLRNGDRLTARLLLDVLPIVGGNAPAGVKLDELRTVAFSLERPGSVSVTLRNNSRIQGTLALVNLPLELELGPTLSLARDDIEEISDLVAGTAEAANLARGAGRDAASARLKPGETAPNTEGLVWIPAGEFLMGSPYDESGRDVDEGPQTRVKILRGFWMARCEVTQSEYEQVMGTNPSNATGDGARPVERVTWYEAVDYCRKLGEQATVAGRLPQGYSYRLPTEAEWEYAARAGTTTQFSYGQDPSGVRLGDYAWFLRNSESMTHPVGTRAANPWGLCDMHGNVWEWCLDRWEGALPGGTVTNHTTATAGTLRVARGGSWLYESKACRSANRDDYSPSNRCSDLGFRVVLAPLEP